MPGGGCGGRAEVLPLAEPGRARGEVQRDVVAGARELGGDRVRDRALLGADDADARARAAAAACPRARPAQLAPARRGPRVGDEVARAAGEQARAARASRSGPRDTAGRPVDSPARCRPASVAAGASASRIRPAVWAERTMPLPQRRRPMCQTQPASVRSSARQRGGDALLLVEAAAVAAAVPGGAREAADARVGARAAVVDARGGDVADAPARRAQAPLPLLLVAGPGARGVERADALDRGAAHGEVRPPDELRVAVLRPEVERR